MENICTFSSVNIYFTESTHTVVLILLRLIFYSLSAQSKNKQNDKHLKIITHICNHRYGKDRERKKTNIYHLLNHRFKKEETEVNSFVLRHHKDNRPLSVGTNHLANK